MAYELNGLITGLQITGHLIFYLMMGIIVFAGKEIVNKIKRLLYKRKAVEVELIGPDRKSAIVVCKKKDDSYYEVDGLPFFINPLKSIKRNGVEVFTHVLGNSFPHDFISNPKDILKKIVGEAREEKKVKIHKKEKKADRTIEEITEEVMVKDITGSFHNIFDEPYRVDARMLQEVLINAQLSSKTLWDEIIKIFKNKNLITIAIAALIGIGIILLFTFQTYDYLTHIKVCEIASTINV